MRSLAYGSFTHEKVDQHLRSSSPPFSFRFEILDRSFNVIDELPSTGTGIGGLSTVQSAAAENFVDRDHKGALTLTMGAYEPLRDQMLRRLIRPYLQLRMPNHQLVEYPMGAYLWMDPERQLPNVSVEEWSVTLPDQTWLLSAQSPGPQGFVIRKGQRVTDVIRDLYRSFGFTDLSGIADSDETIAETKWWTYLTPNTPEYGQRNDLQQQLESIRRDLKTETDQARLTELRSSESTAMATLLELDAVAPPTDETFVSVGVILAQLSSGIGYNSPAIDYTGERPIAAPARDLASESADHHYDTGPKSIIASLGITPDHSTIANRVFVKATNVDGLYGMVVADANDVFPNHPLSQRKVGVFIDVALEDSTAGTTDALTARAQKELGERLAKVKNATMTMGLHPAHEPWDLVGITYTDDPDFDEETVFTQRSVKFDFDNKSQELGMGLVVR